MCAHRSYLYYTELITHWNTNLPSKASLQYLCFPKFLELTYLWMRLNECKSFVVTETNRNSKNSAKHTYRQITLEKATKDENKWDKRFRTTTYFTKYLPCLSRKSRPSPTFLEMFRKLKPVPIIMRGVPTMRYHLKTLQGLHIYEKNYKKKLSLLC